MGSDSIVGTSSSEVRPRAVPLARLPALVAEISLGQSLTFIGVDAPILRAAFEAAEAPARPALVVDIADAPTADAAIGRILDDLGDLALAAWPNWRATGDSGSEVWRRAAARLAAAGRRPRFRRAPAAIEFQQLVATLDPAGLTLIASVDFARPIAAQATIAAIEWCVGRGAAVCIGLAARPPALPPFDRILYGAVEIARAPPSEPTPAIARLISPLGAPHHASVTEARIQAAILRDPDLAPLFAYNVVLRTSEFGLPSRVDLVWQEGRVVVELDGPEHYSEPAYSADRQRDYELTVAGYLVLRITNAQVAYDLGHAIEKIRTVVRFRKSEGRLRR
jgi:hypothetical protein